jgi:hypothetical protein
MTEQAAGASASAAHGTPDAQTRFAPLGPRISNLIASCYFGLLLLAGALVPGVLWWVRVLAWLGLAVLVLLNWRIMRLAVVAAPEGLIIRNFRNTHRIPWRGVEQIYQPGPVPPAMYRETALPKWKQGLFVRLTEGAVISCTIYNESLYPGGRLRLLREARPGGDRTYRAAGPVYRRRGRQQRRRRQCPRFAIVRPLGNMPESHVRVAE